MDLSIFRTADKQSVRMELGIPLDAKMILFTANGIRKNRYKDYQTFRETINLIANKLVGERKIFVGLGESAPSKQIGQTIIRFVRYEKNPKTVAKYYQAADVYVHPVRAETWGLTITEALACGTPVVATNVGGIPEQIEKGITGFLVPAGDAEGMATRVIELLTTDNLRNRMGITAAESMRRQFDLNRQAEEYLAWYAEIIKKHKILFLSNS